MRTSESEHCVGEPTQRRATRRFLHPPIPWPQGRLSDTDRLHGLAKKKPGHTGPAQVFVGTETDNHLPEGNSWLHHGCQSGRMSQPAAYSAFELWASIAHRATQRVACQPCGSRKRWKILLGCCANATSAADLEVLS